MPTQNVNLPDHQSDFIKLSVQKGRYQNASEVVRAGLRLLEQQDAENALKLKAMRKAIKDGFTAIDSGAFTTVTPDSVGDFVGSLSARPAGASGSQSSGGSGGSGGR